MPATFARMIDEAGLQTVFVDNEIPQLTPDHRFFYLGIMHKGATPPDWAKRADRVRRQILIAEGLWPMPTKTPLNAVIGFSEVLQARMFGPLNEKQAECVQDVLQSGRHLLSLINDILDLSKIEADRMTVETLATPIVAVALGGADALHVRLPSGSADA